MNKNTYFFLLVAFVLLPFIATAQNTYYVDSARPDNSGNGNSWATAKKDLQIAINAAASGDAIWVKAGTYLPTHDPFGNTSPANNRDKTFTLKSGVKVYGGFSGSETALSQRSWRTNVTTLSGDLGTLNVLTDNAYHVVMSVNTSNLTVLDGVTVTKGYATAPWQSRITVGGRVIDRCKGGGIYSSYSGTSYENCTIRANSADNTDSNDDAWGAGMVSEFATNSIFTNCYFDGNTFLAGGSSFGAFGCGLNILGGTNTITKCIFANNHGADAFFDGSRGGAIYNSGGILNITNTIFYNNYAMNAASIGGGGGGQTTITNCTFANNTCKFQGTTTASFLKADFKNCILWNNIPTNSSLPTRERDEVFSQENRPEFQATFTNCIIRNTVGSPIGITNTICSNVLNSNPLFVNYADGDGPDNIWGTSDDGIQIQSNSPARNFGITGANVPSTDIVGSVRDAQPDLGAYEYATPCVNPTAYTVTGGGNYCVGGSGVPVGLSGSEIGVTYQLKRNSVATGAALSGTGSPISFGNQLLAGTYIVEATRTIGLCTSNMTGSVSVTIPSNVTPAFNAVVPICSGAALNALPTVSLNNISGSWSPALNNTATTTYTFTPNTGQCATTTTLSITVNPNVTPTFTAVSPICSGTVLSALPTTSNNGINGSWSPALDNTQTTTYTFTPANGVCATNATMTITVNPNVAPTFTAVSPICSGASLSALPTTSNNGISGSWTPALDNTQTTTYTFTPANGVCATTATMTITVNPNVTPVFTAVSPICSGATLSALPGTSNNGINGSWAPALDNTQTTTYTFTPANGVCATTATMTITVNPNVAPTFTAVSPICSGAALSALPTTSNNGISGSWSPALDNTQTTTYTFTPANGVCATNATMTITVNPNVAPTFTAVSPICSGASLSALPTTSNNGISGSWTPALDNTQTTTYTFTPANGVCATTATMTITVNPNITPTFTAVSPICSGASLSALPTTSNNGITGSWAPALDNTQTTTYTFTPANGVCAATATISITVNSNVTPVFTAVSPICSGAELSALPGTSNNGINGSWSPALDNTQTTTYTFTPANGVCATTATMTITVNPNITPVFTAVSPICSGAALSALPTTSNNGISGSWAPALDNTQTTTYTFTPANGVCATTAAMTITVNPNVTPVFTAVSPICSGAELSALPGTSNNGINGSWSPALDNTQTTTYTFTPANGVCATTATMTITVNPNITPVFTAVSPICSGAALSALPTTSNNGISGSWAPALDNTQTTTYTFTPANGVCATTATMTITVTTVPAPIGNAVQTFNVQDLNDATIEDLVVSPTDVIWYGSISDALSGLNPLPATTVLVNDNSYYAVSSENGCNSVPLEITVTITLGNDGFENIKFNISPNPTTGILNILGNTIIDKIEVINTLGQVIQSKNIGMNTAEIDLSLLPSNIFFIRISSNKSSKTFKIIKK